jgi:uncharacterized protein
MKYDVGCMKIDGSSFPIVLPRDKIIAFCRRWKIQELSFFGSLVRDDFGPESDIDVLIRYAPDAKRSLLRHITAQQELAEILGRSVDLVSKTALEKSNNQWRREAILTGARLYYSDEKAA